MFELKVSDLLALIQSNPNSTGLIISVDGNGISARPKPSSNGAADSSEGAVVYGCPFPPGCTE